MTPTPPARSRRVTPTLIIAATCLVLGSTGGAVAGTVITGKQIKNNTVTSVDIKDKSLKTKDLAKGTVKRLKGATGATGPAGADGADGRQGSPGDQGEQGQIGRQGDQGEPGQMGPAGLSQLSYVTATSASVANGQATSVIGACETGKTAISAGAEWVANDSSPVEVIADPANPDRWTARGTNNGAATSTLRIRVLCAYTE